MKASQTKMFICIASIIIQMIMRLTHGRQSPDPKPEPWPEQFHAKLYTKLSSQGYEQVTDMWYDWPKGRNSYMMQRQLQPLLHEVEWNNGTSFYFTFGKSPTCDLIDFGVGITRPDFLQDARYIGTQLADGGFLCNVWEKAEFIRYFEDASTKLPVKWDFFADGITTHVITFEADAVLEDSLTQAPEFCFNQPKDSTSGVVE